MAKPIYLNTTGTLSPVPVNDLGKIPGYIHPPVDWDIREEYSIGAISNSKDLQAAVDAGYITLTASDGSKIQSIRNQGEGSVGITEGSKSVIERASFLNFLGNVSVTGTTGVANIEILGGAGSQGPQGVGGAGPQGPTGNAGVTGVADESTVVGGFIDAIASGSLTGVPLGVGFIESAEEATEVSTTVFQRKLALRWGENADQNQRRQYRIEWYFEHTVNTASRIVQTRLRIDDEDPDIGQDIYEPSSANSYVMRSGWFEKSFSPTGPTGAVGHTVTMEFRRFPGGGGGAIASIRRARIKVFDLGAAD